MEDVNNQRRNFISPSELGYGPKEFYSRKAYKKKLFVFKNKNGFVTVAVNLSFRASFLRVNIFNRGVNLTVNKISATKTFWKMRLDV